MCVTDEEDSEGEADLKKDTAAVKKEAVADNSDGVVPQLDKKKDSTTTGFQMDNVMISAAAGNTDDEEMV